jgi:hypothetical protein
MWLERVILGKGIAHCLKTPPRGLQPFNKLPAGKFNNVSSSKLRGGFTPHLLLPICA